MNFESPKDTVDTRTLFPSTGGRIDQYTNSTAPDGATSPLPYAGTTLYPRHYVKQWPETVKTKSAQGHWFAYSCCPCTVYHDMHGFLRRGSLNPCCGLGFWIWRGRFNLLFSVRPLIRMWFTLTLSFAVINTKTG